MKIKKVIQEGSRSDDCASISFDMSNIFEKDVLSGATKCTYANYVNGLLNKN